ncbi:hypothetical protein IQ260_14885 [Leptolyngbya cf. ectocarpi LEGE 11479]|uniref:Uncharacterized protein n=1 Tax=Leptolyngbya cf. ectocarpi LEGE 11479 TaxID=1828722 RepID=A0A928ZUX6_LEPEC|nr:hypothetical protein [Leptolyngbya ectocarpi]MBE9067937.1 hypothetical protein [Leptolyngbya cf. ectocarpi LEGE 11479]
MQHSPDPNFQQPRIKWSWLTLSCISLLAGFSYLAIVDLTSPVQLTQNPLEQQP